MKQGYLFLLLLPLLGATAFAQEQTLSSHDFAYGIPLEVDGDGAIYSLPLPQEVYRYTTRKDLGDVRIFNGYGEVVPHMLQPGKSYQEVPREPDHGRIGAALAVLEARLRARLAHGL